jgi:hypothetical protein
LLRLLKSDPTLGIRPQPFALLVIKVKSHSSITVIPLQNTPRKVPVLQDRSAEQELPAPMNHSGRESGDNCKIDCVELRPLRRDNPEEKRQFVIP